VFGHLRAAFNFWQLRDAEFKNPIVRGAIKETAEPRNRVLAPDELADIWRALDELEHVPATFAAYVKILVLTACRRCEVANMHSDEIDGKTWTIPAARYKTGIDHVVPLIGPIKKLLPKIHNGYVFGCASHRHHQAAGAAPLRGYHKAKRELDAAIAEIRRREGRKPMRPWTFHDLRRTAATMMEQIGINDKVAEAVLGHAKIGIRKHYNHYKFLPEKTAALEKLAAHVERITKPRTPAAATKLRLVAG
jgi:integrase